MGRRRRTGSRTCRRQSTCKKLARWSEEVGRMRGEWYISLYLKFLHIDCFQMEKYWKNRPQVPPRVPLIDITSGDTGSASVLSDYDRYRRTLLSTTECDGWEAELRRYLKDMPADVSPETDIVEWWQVCLIIFSHCFISEIYTRITLSCILPLHALLWISSLSPPLLCHVNDSSQQQRKLQMIGVLI